MRELSSDQILSPNIPLISVTIIARKLSFGVCVCVLRVWEGDYVRSYLLIIALETGNCLYVLISPSSSGPTQPGFLLGSP